MKIPNTNLLRQLGALPGFGGRLWRLPPASANTWHKHVYQWEWYFVLEGTGRMRVGEETITVPRYGCLLVEPQRLRQVFNDTEREVLWLVIGVGEDGDVPKEAYYPEDPRSLPPELEGKVWPPAG